VDTAADPLLGAERAEALSLAVLLLLERLTPAERAAYVLREAFDYSFRDIADVLETSEANARQLATRARKNIDRDRGHTVSAEQRDQLLAAITTAAENGDLRTLESMLAAQATSTSDGGGVVLAARKVVAGRERVAQFILGVLDKFADNMVPVLVSANGETAIVGLRDGKPVALWTAEVTDEGVAQLLIVLNPHKLSQFEGLSGLNS
jgi:RNA polymerase sigma-70 factor (ECF subfamily)